MQNTAEIASLHESARALESTASNVRVPEVGTATNAALLSALGVVVIGRNEGERLARCLRSIEELAQNVVYVDSI
jgi:hypothetical protein